MDSGCLANWHQKGKSGRKKEDGRDRENRNSGETKKHVKGRKKSFALLNNMTEETELARARREGGERVVPPGKSFCDQNVGQKPKKGGNASPQGG